MRIALLLLPILVPILVVAVMLVSPFAGQAQEIKCQVEKATKDGIIKIGNKTLTLWKTGLDRDINSDCGQQWANPTDNWLYGEFWPLYKDERGKGGRGAELFVQSNPQPTLSRNVCWDAGADGDTPYDRRLTVGYFATEYTAKSAVGRDGNRGDLNLDFLCVPENQRGGGTGTKLINLAVQEKTSRFLDDQSLTLRIVSHAAAEDFYNKLLLSCQAEDYDGQTRNLYTATVKKGEAVSRRPRYWLGSEVDMGDCVEVVFDCTSLSDYDDAVDGAVIVEDESCVGRSKGKTPETIKFSEIPE